MDILKIATIRSDIDQDINADIFNINRKQLRKLKQYTFSSTLTKEEDSTPTNLALLIPVGPTHVIVTMHLNNNEISLNIRGTIEKEGPSQGYIALCNFWFLENDEVYFEAMEEFVWHYSDQKPCSLPSLLIDNQMIKRVFLSLLDFYINRRKLHMRNEKFMEDYSIEIK